MPISPIVLENFTNHFEHRYRGTYPRFHGVLARFLRNNTSFFLDWVKEFAFEHAENDGFDYTDLLRVADALRERGYRMDTPPCSPAVFSQMQESRFYLLQTILAAEFAVLEAQARASARLRGDNSLLAHMEAAQGSDAVEDVSIGIGTDAQGNILFVFIGAAAMATPHPSADAFSAAAAPIPPRAYVYAKELKSLGCTEEVPEDMWDLTDYEIMDEPVKIRGEEGVYDKQSIPRFGGISPTTRRPFTDADIESDAVTKVKIYEFMERARAAFTATNGAAQSAAPGPVSTPGTGPS